MDNLPKRETLRLNNYDYSQNGCYFITICTNNGEHLFGEIVGATLCGRPNNPDKMIEKWLLELENKFFDVKIYEYIIMPNHVHFIISKTGDHTVAAGDHIGSPLQSGYNKGCCLSGDIVTGDHTGSPLQPRQNKGYCLSGDVVTGDHTGAPLQSGYNKGYCLSGEVVTGDHAGSPLQPEETVGAHVQPGYNKGCCLSGEGVSGDHAGSPLQPGYNKGCCLSGDIVTGDHTGSPLQFGYNKGYCLSGEIAAGDHTGAPLQDIVGWFKTMTTNEYIKNVKQNLYLPFHKRLWQRNYYEHVIRNEQDYLRIVEYIRNNPLRWEIEKVLQNEPITENVCPGRA